MSLALHGGNFKRNKTISYKWEIKKLRHEWLSKAECKLKANAKIEMYTVSGSINIKLYDRSVSR